MFSSSQCYSIHPSARELARSFGATLVVLVTVVMTMMLIRTLGQASRGSVSPSDVMLVMGFTVLGQLPTILSLSLFIAVVGTLSRMYPRQRNGDLFRQRARPDQPGAPPVAICMAGDGGNRRAVAAG